MYKFSQRSKDNLNGVHPDLVRVMERAIMYSPLDFTITDGVRTLEQQRALWAKGRTIPGSIVTHCDGLNVKSPHQCKEDGYCWAVDLYPFHGGKVQVNDAAGLRKIATHIKSIAKELNVKIEWGGDWKSIVDLPHWELKR
jgi:peptidoglycan L-alanyl-D-glutamate endopeptidase CwlK